MGRALFWYNFLVCVCLCVVCVVCCVWLCVCVVCAVCVVCCVVCVCVLCVFVCCVFFSLLLNAFLFHHRSFFIPSIFCSLPVAATHLYTFT